MTENHDTADRFRHDNLVRISQLLTLPARASAERQAAWRAAAPPHVRSFAKRHRILALATSGLAAAAVLVFWLTVGHAKPVSAATILDGFKLALSRSLSIELTDVDLGTVQLSGRILLDQQPPPVAETGLADVHVDFKADHPEWYDLRAKIVICQTPVRAWQYFAMGEMRPDNTPGVTPKNPPYSHTFEQEHLERDRSWRNFWRHPLEGFSRSPVHLYLGYGDNEVTYEFFEQQRAVIEELLRFLLPLGDGHTAEAVVVDLRDSCSRMDVERVDPATYVLHATGFSRLGALELSEPQVPDVSALVRQYVAVINYNVEKGKIWGVGGFLTPELRESGVRIVSTFPPNMPQQSPQELIAWLRERALDVQVDDTNPEQWTIRVTGYPFPLDYSGIDWQREFAKRARDSLALDIFYDSSTHAVQRAVLHGVGSGDGRITFTVGPVQIDPSWLDPEHWKMAPYSPS